ncbi:hypothetical protein F183_A16300 [Bryobacterales bacterium F-183]|nr:hypothetical protein F183_A16300 [Bryobacterales bacterium F-183]
MALISKLFTEESPGKPVLARCAETHAGHLLRGMSSSPAIKDAVARIQRALRQLGFTINDPEGTYGASTEAAVLKFKGPPRNILGAGQSRPDGVVGIQTIHRLDSELVGRSNKWRLAFIGNKPPIGPETFTVFIVSQESRDSQGFSVARLFVDDKLKTGFKGETKGDFETEQRLSAGDFHDAPAQFLIEKKGRSLRGFLQLVLPQKSIAVNVQFAPFKDDAAQDDVSTGTLIVSGTLRKR